MKDTTKTVRIATHNATSTRYIVQQIAMGKTSADDRVHCWGEVAAAKGLSTRHERSKIFPRSEVTVSDVEKTPTLIRELWHQGLRALEASGKNVSLSRTGRTATIR